MPNVRLVHIYLCQVEIKVDDVRPKMDKNGNIKKNDFIELSIEAKLLDVSERKPAAETPKEQKSVKKYFTFKTSSRYTYVCIKSQFDAKTKLLYNFFLRKSQNIQEKTGRLRD